MVKMSHKYIGYKLISKIMIKCKIVGQQSVQCTIVVVISNQWFPR